MYHWNDPSLCREFNRIKQDAVEDGFTIEDVSSCYLDGFTKKTKSPRILRFIRLAYWRGYLRGIRHADEGNTPISIHDTL